MEVVLELVAMHGTEAVSAQLIADTVGVTQPAVFRHFRTKQDIWIAVLHWLEEQLQEIMIAEAQGQKPALDVLRRIFLDHLSLIRNYPALAKLVLSDHLRLRYPVLQTQFARIHGRYAARVVAIVDRAKSEGTVSGSVVSKDAAMMFLGLLQGLGFQFAIARLPMQLSRDGERVFAMYQRGLATAAGPQAGLPDTDSPTKGTSQANDAA